MTTTTKLIIVLAVHIISAIITLWISVKDGTFEYAVKHGDGIRYATVSGVLFLCLVLPEIILLENILDFISYKINSIAENHYKE